MLNGFQSCSKNLNQGELWWLRHHKKGKLPKLKKSFCPKVLAQFENYFGQMFLGALYQDFKYFRSVEKMATRVGACFPYMCIVKTLKIFLFKSTCHI